MRKSAPLLRFALPLLVVAIGSAQTPCERLKSLSLPNTTITAAESVAAGPFRAPDRPKDAPLTLPAHCRVAATLAPTADSKIEMEVWLPAENWNGKFQAVGNGGWAGNITFVDGDTSAVAHSMASALQENYATASSDTGHNAAETPGASFALGHPEKLIDFGYRAVHETTLKTKAIVTAFYGKPPKLSYWNSCSNGGRQALMEAQRYPGDFDGVIAGSPGANWTGRATQAIWVAQAVHRDEGSAIPPAKFAAIHAAVLAACDARDGVKDGVLENPRKCKFDPQVLECKGADGPECLTSSQVETARRIYAAAVNPRTHQEIVPGSELGSELGWSTMASPRPFGLGTTLFQYVVFKNPDWDYKTFDFDQDMARTLQAGGMMNALDPNLEPFFKHGGKLLQYHGWADPQIPPGSSVAYYESVVEKMRGTKTLEKSYRLFMVPGMAHCGGGNGPNRFDAMSALETWVEKGKAPETIVASHSTNGQVDRTRPLCPYPQVASYKGTGSTNDAANFACKAQ